MRGEHLQQAEARWESAVQNFGELLRPEDANLQRLSILLMTASLQSRCYAAGALEYGFDAVLNGFPGLATNDPCTLMEKISSFMWGSLIKGDLPGIGYYRQEDFGFSGFTVCGPEAEGAKPYFHRDLLELRKIQPQAEALTIEKAIQILEGYEKERRAFAARIRKEILEVPDSCWDDEDADAYDCDEGMLDRAALVSEIMQAWR
jgi:hypothetical protein